MLKRTLYPFVAAALAVAVVGCTPSFMGEPDGHGNTKPDHSTTQVDQSITPPTDGPITPPADMNIPRPDTLKSIDHLVFTGQCTDDGQCPADQYCQQGTGSCVSLTSGSCTKTNTSACLGANPQCKDGSCYNAGGCNTNADCHEGETCTSHGGSSLCYPTSPCPGGEVVNSMDVANGLYAEGKEVCVTDVVENVLCETDGDYHIRLGKSWHTPVCGLSPSPTNCAPKSGTCQYIQNPPGDGLITELTPEYQIPNISNPSGATCGVGTASCGLNTPSIGQTITVEGTVRWDQYHCWWEVHPVKWWQ
jgi:hypothetical protein